MKKLFSIFGLAAIFTASIFCNSRLQFRLLDSRTTESLMMYFANHEKLSPEEQIAEANTLTDKNVVGLYSYADEEPVFQNIIAVEDDIILTEDSITDVSVKKEYNNYTLNITLSEEAENAFAEFTEENVGNYIVIIYDGNAIMNAKLYEKISGGKISLSNIDYNFAKAFAENLGFDSALNGVAKKTSEKFIRVYQMDQELTNQLTMLEMANMYGMPDAAENIKTLKEENKDTKEFFNFSGATVVCEKDPVFTDENIKSFEKTDIVPEGYENGYSSQFVTLAIKTDKASFKKVAAIDKNAPTTEDFSGNTIKPCYLYCVTSDENGIPGQITNKKIVLYFVNQDELEFFQNFGK